MAMFMQPFLNSRTELRDRCEVPEEVCAALTDGGWPSISSSSKLTMTEHETFVLTFSQEPAAALAPISPHGGDRMSAVLHVVGCELGASPVFAADAPASAEQMRRTLALAAAAGAAVPQVWLHGEIARRGALRRLTYVLLEQLPDRAASPGLSLPLPSSLPPSAMDGLACYQDAASLLVEMRRLAIIAGATELDDPLTRLAAHCRDACDPPTELCLLVGIVSLPISAADGQDGAVAASESTQAPTVRLDSVAPWPNAAVADPRILTTAESPWDLVRAVCHVVKVSAQRLDDFHKHAPAPFHGLPPDMHVLRSLVGFPAGAVAHRLLPSYTRVGTTLRGEYLACRAR